MPTFRRKDCFGALCSHPYAAGSVCRQASRRVENSVHQSSSHCIGRGMYLQAHHTFSVAPHWQGYTVATNFAQHACQGHWICSHTTDPSHAVSELGTYCGGLGYFSQADGTCNALALNRAACRDLRDCNCNDLGNCLHGVVQSEPGSAITNLSKGVLAKNQADGPSADAHRHPWKMPSVDQVHHGASCTRTRPRLIV